MIREGKRRQDKTRQDQTRQDKRRQDKTRQDKIRIDKTKQDKTSSTLCRILAVCSFGSVVTVANPLLCWGGTGRIVEKIKLNKRRHITYYKPRKDSPSHFVTIPPPPTPPAATQPRHSTTQPQRKHNMLIPWV